jgi:hypothetical protein
LHTSLHEWLGHVLIDYAAAASACGETAAQQRSQLPMQAAANIHISNSGQRPEVMNTLCDFFSSWFSHAHLQHMAVASTFVDSMSTHAAVLPSIRPDGCFAKPAQFTRMLGGL